MNADTRSIRVMFSIADIQNTEEESEFDQDGDEGGEQDHAHGYPVRVSFSVTKVCCFVVGFFWWLDDAGSAGTGQCQGFAQH